IDARDAELIEKMVQAVGEKVEPIVTGQAVRAAGSREICHEHVSQRAQQMLKPRHRIHALESSGVENMRNRFGGFQVFEVAVRVPESSPAERVGSCRAGSIE